MRHGERTPTNRTGQAACRPAHGHQSKPGAGAASRGRHGPVAQQLCSRDSERLVDEEQSRRDTVGDLCCSRLGRQIGAIRGRCVSTGTTRGRVLSDIVTPWRVVSNEFRGPSSSPVPNPLDPVARLQGAGERPDVVTRDRIAGKLASGRLELPRPYGHRLLRPTRLPFRHEAVPRRMSFNHC